MTHLFLQRVLPRNESLTPVPHKHQIPPANSPKGGKSKSNSPLPDYNTLMRERYGEKADNRTPSRPPMRESERDSGGDGAMERGRLCLVTSGLKQQSSVSLAVTKVSSRGASPAHASLSSEERAPTPAENKKRKSADEALGEKMRLPIKSPYILNGRNPALKNSNPVETHLPPQARWK